MTPMIDVVFLLIIFFLVSSHLAKQEFRPPLELPMAGPQPMTVESAERLTINISTDESLSAGGAIIDQQRLTERLQRHVDQYGDAAAVRIRTDRSVPYARVEPLLRVAAEAGVSHIAFSVREER